MLRLPLLRLLAPFVLGIALEEMLGWPPVVAACSAGLGLFAVALHWLGFTRATLIALCGEFWLGMALGALALAIRLHAPIPHVGDGPADLTLLEPPRQSGSVCRLSVFVHGEHPGRALLRSSGESCALLPGQRVIGRVELQRLRPATNPGGASPRRRWARHGIRASGKVAESRLLPVGPAPRGLPALLERARRRIGDVLDPPATPRRAGGLLRALVTGRRERLQPELIRVFAASGTAHLLAISGLHVAWVFAVIHLGVGSLLRRSARPGVLRSARPASLVAGVGAAGLYAALAGFGVPALRAAAMALAGTLAILQGRRGASANALVGAALVVVAVEPAALFEAPFALSFTAVVGILLWAPPPGRVAALFHCTLAAGLATAPWVAHLGAPLPWGALAANAVAIPLFGALVVPLGILTGGLGLLSPEAATGLRPLAHAVAELGIRALSFLESADLLRGCARPVSLGAGLASTGFALRLLARGFPVPALALGGIALALGLRLGVPVESREAPTILVLDVGHGDAVLVESGGEAWLVDAGPRFGGFDAGRDVVLPSLRAEGVTRLDVLVLTHSDQDHLGGARSILESLPVGEVWMGRGTWKHAAARPLRLAAARHGVPIRVVDAGHRAEHSALSARVLWPPAAEVAPGSNTGSLALRIELPGGCVLLPGDIPARVERLLAPEVRPCEVLKLAHHGSRTSTDPAWLRKLAPWLAVSSAGHRTRSPLPHPSVREHLRSASVTLYETARTGALRVRFTRGGVVAEPHLSSAWERTSPGPHADRGSTSR